MAWGEKPASEGVRKDFDVVIGGTREVTIGSIEWRAALDVYCNIPNADAFGGSALINSVFKLYAVSGSARVAIAGNVPMPNTTSGGGFPMGDAYVVGARNVVCDHFDLTVQNPGGEVTASGESPGRVTMIAWGTTVSGPPEPIPSGFPDPAGSATPNAVMVDPFLPKGGAGEFGSGAIHDNNSAALANFRLAASAPGRGVQLVEIIGYTTAAGTNWIQLFDSPGPSAYPANGAVSVFDFPVAQNQSFSFFPEGGLRFKDGILWALSSTPRVMTQVAGATCRLDTSFYR